MSQANTPPPFSLSAPSRLAAFVSEQAGGADAPLEALTPDASTREYFRIPWTGAPAVAAVYPEPFTTATQPFLDVTGLFVEAGLPVPEIYAVDERRGLIIQEDCGDCQLYNFYQNASRKEAEARRDEAIKLIARIQGATTLAFERASIASRLAFDEEKLGWELGFFQEHFFGTLRGEKMPKREARQLETELNEVARELAARPRVLCHRDFHAGNLLVDQAGRLRVIDYQDARMGPASYDLVSLLLDRVTAPPSLAEIRLGRLRFLEARQELGLPPLEAEDFTAEFRLMTVQRVLKAIGTFSFQTGARGRGALYARYIPPMLLVAAQAAGLLGRFPTLQTALKTRAARSYE